MDMREIQDWVKEFNMERGWSKPNYNAFVDFSYLAQEVGEVSTEITRLEIGREGKRDVEEEKNKEILLENLSKEIGDVLFSLCTIANRYDIDINEAFKLFKEKMSERF